MRLWSLHPCYLDAAGLVALWREALLAQAVLRGQTRGYQHHPQLQRFRAAVQPDAAIAEYLRSVQHEAAQRGYRFDARKIPDLPCPAPLMVSCGQLDYEWAHLHAKLSRRDPARWAEFADVLTPHAHPLFQVIDGPVADWEKRPASLANSPPLL